MLVPSNESLRAASIWFARLQSTDASKEDLALHQGWMSASPENNAAYDFVLQTASLAGDAMRAPVPTRRPIDLGQQSYVPHRNLLRGGLAIGSAIVVLLIVIAGWQSFGIIQRPTMYRTDVGKLRTIVLQDGTNVTLSGASTMAVNFDNKARAIRLETGEAFFSVAKNSSTPFVVMVGDRIIQDIGTVFDVYDQRDTIGIAVREGAVLVSRHNDTAQTQSSAMKPHALILSRGEAVDFIPAASSGIRRTVSPEQIGAWRDGVLVYETLPLSRIVADLNRQFRGSIVIEGERLQSMPVSLTLKLETRERTLQTLQQLLPIQVVQVANDTTVIRAAPSP